MIDGALMDRTVLMSWVNDPDHSAGGFSLVEMLLSLVVLVIVAGGVFTSFNQGQLTYQSQEDATEVIRVGRFAMDQIVTYLRQAGNDPEDYLDSNSLPPIQILGTGHVRINTDLTGSVPDPSDPTDPLKSTGDPDGTVDNIYEQVVLRYDSSEEQIYLDIGYGEKVLASNISSLNLIFYDGAGNTTVTESAIVRVEVDLVAESANSDLLSGKIQTITLNSSVMLRSKGFQSF